MKQRKRTVLLVVIAVVFSLSACGTGRQMEPDTTAASEAVQGSSADPGTPVHSAEPTPEPDTDAASEAVQESSAEPGMTDHSAEPTPEPDEPEVSAGTENDEDEEESMRLFIGDTEVSVAWEDNEAVGALIELAETEPLIIEMSMYGGFEQVGSLGASLPRNDEQTTTEAGDIVLYAGDQIVVFYGSNSWAYTRLGRITDRTPAEMTDLLGGGNVTITISYGGH
jgi:hypothetical protein